MVSFQLENVPFNIQSYSFECNDACMFTDNYDSSYCFWVFEKRLIQNNCFLFCKKYGLFNSFIFLKIKKFLLSHFPNFHDQRSRGGGGGGDDKILVCHTRSRVVSAMERVCSKNLYTDSFTRNEL